MKGPRRNAPARLTVAVNRTAPEWRAALPGATALARRAARAALAGAAARDGRAVEGAAELSLVLADDSLLHHLNRQYRCVDRPTNVLSFPGGANSAPAAPSGGAEETGMPLMLGDVVLAVQTVAAEAAAQGKTMADHFTHLVVHGVLHLLGYDHITSAEARQMESLEVAVLGGLGIADPYRRPAARGGRRRTHAAPRRAARG